LEDSFSLLKRKKKKDLSKGEGFSGRRRELRSTIKRMHSASRRGEGEGLY